MKVVINYQEYTEVGIEKGILSQIPGIEIVESHSRTAEEFIPEVRDADALIVQYAPCSREVIGAMEKCKVIVRYGIAVDTIDLAAAKSRGIKVCNVPHYCLDEVSNHALAMILALHRRIFIGDRLLREDRHQLEKLRPIPRLSGLTLGLLGFGRIARRMVKKAKPLFGEIIAYDPLIPPEELTVKGVRPVSLEKLFMTGDFLSIHIPSTPKTKHLVSREMIFKMKPSAYLVNTSRGAVIDEQALVEALQEKKIAGAGMDVFEIEPLPLESPLRKLDNVIITSHYAWYSEGAIKELKETAAMEAVRVLRGEAPLYQVMG